MGDKSNDKNSMALLKYNNVQTNLCGETKMAETLYYRPGGKTTVKSVYKNFKPSTTGASILQSTGSIIV